MNTAEKIRYCKSCPPDRPTILSAYNKGSICNCCAEKKLYESVVPVSRPQLPPQKPKPFKSVSRDACSNCERTGLQLHKRKDGYQLCSLCKMAGYGLIGEARDRAMADAAARAKGKGRMRPGPQPGRIKNGR